MREAEESVLEDEGMSWNSLTNLTRDFEAL